MEDNHLSKEAMKSTHFKKAITSHKLLAQERTIFANERNTLAYVRTGFASFVLGIALIKLFEQQTNYIHAGYGALIIGTIFILVGVIYYPIRKKKILGH